MGSSTPANSGTNVDEEKKKDSKGESAASVAAAPSKDSLFPSTSPEEGEDDDKENTEPEPTREEIEHIGELSAALSKISVRIDKDDYQHSPSTKGIRKWIQSLRPMIQGRFMWCMAITNFVLFIVLILMFIYLVVFAVLTGTSFSRVIELSGNIDKLEHCSVFWSDWSNCSAKCQNRDKNAMKILNDMGKGGPAPTKDTDGNKKNSDSEKTDAPTRTRYVVDVIGAKDKCPKELKKNDEEFKDENELKKVVDSLWCNVWSCKQDEAS